MPQIDFKTWGPLTVLAVVLISLLALAGAIIAAVQPSTLTFDQYFDDMKWVLGALGLAVPVGRAVHLAATQPVANPVPGPFDEEAMVDEEDYAAVKEKLATGRTVRAAGHKGEPIQGYPEVQSAPDDVPATSRRPEVG